MFKFQGQVTKINAANQVSDKFKKRTFVLTDGAQQYPNFIEFQLTQKNCDLIEGVRVGDEVEVTFGLKGRNWTDKSGEIKTFNTLDVFRITKLQAKPKDLGSSFKSFEPQDETNLPF